jgi:hypothetical protein
MKERKKERKKERRTERKERTLKGEWERKENIPMTLKAFVDVGKETMKSTKIISG